MNRQLVSRVWVWLPISRVPLHWGQHLTALFVQWNFWRKEGNKQFCYGFFLRSCTLFPKFLGFSSTVNSAHTDNYRVKLLQTTGPDLMCNYYKEVLVILQGSREL